MAKRWGQKILIQIFLPLFFAFVTRGKTKPIESALILGMKFITARASCRQGIRQWPQFARLNGAHKAGFEIVGDDFEVIVGLEIEPPSRVGAKVSGGPQRRVRSDCPLSAHNLTHADRSNSDGLGQHGLTEAQRLHKVMEKYLPRMNRRKLFRIHTLTIVHGRKAK